MATEHASHTAAQAGTLEIGGDLVVNRLGFGAMRITGPGIWGEPQNREEAGRVLKRALQLGVNFIDTADSYGPAVSERIIYETLYPYPEGLVIATKGGLERTGPGQWPANGRPEHLRKALEGSLRRLRLERIDLYQFHRPDPGVPFEESVGTLVRMREEGKIRHIGLSNVDVDQLRRAQKMTPIVSVQNRYNMHDRASEDVLEVCHSENIAFIPWYPVGSALETDADSELQQVASAHHATTTQIALAWLLMRSPVMLPIPGTSRVSHLEENVAAAGIELSSEEFERLGS